jgi:hypothetical protein
MDSFNRPIPKNYNPVNIVLRTQTGAKFAKSQLAHAHKVGKLFYRDFQVRCPAEIF